MNIKNIYINTDLILVLSLAIACDMISGSIKSVINKTFKSSDFRTGLLKKGLDYILVIVSIIVGYVLTLEYIEPATLTVLIFMELSSIVENCNEIIKVPKLLKETIEQNTEKDEETEETYNG